MNLRDFKTLGYFLLLSAILSLGQTTAAPSTVSPGSAGIL